MGLEIEKKYLELNGIKSYRIAYGLSNYVWTIAVKWDFFAKDTVGKQFVSSVDSISANIIRQSNQGCSTI